MSMKNAWVQKKLVKSPPAGKLIGRKYVECNEILTAENACQDTIFTEYSNIERDLTCLITSRSELNATGEEPISDTTGSLVWRLDIAGELGS